MEGPRPVGRGAPRHSSFPLPLQARGTIGAGTYPSTSAPGKREVKERELGGPEPAGSGQSVHGAAGLPSALSRHGWRYLTQAMRRLPQASGDVLSDHTGLRQSMRTGLWSEKPFVASGDEMGRIRGHAGRRVGVRGRDGPGGWRPGGDAGGGSVPAPGQRAGAVLQQFLGHGCCQWLRPCWSAKPGKIQPASRTSDGAQGGGFRHTGHTQQRGAGLRAGTARV